MAMPDYAEVRPVFILSKEDPDFEINLRLIKGWDYLVYKNDPLGEKLNAGLEYAKQFKWDYLMNMGSDNVCTPFLWDFYAPYFQAGNPFFGINNYYIWDVCNDRAGIARNYNFDDESDGPHYVPIGAGRMIAREIIDKIEGDLWRGWWLCGLDGCSRYKIYEYGYRDEVVEVGDVPVLLDVKTNTNLTHISEIEDRIEWVNLAWVKEQFGIDDLDYLDSEVMELVVFEKFNLKVCKLTQQIGQRNAFNTVNSEYKQAFGEERFRSYHGFLNTRTKKK
jgi:hypothetical protein